MFHKHILFNFYFSAVGDLTKFSHCHDHHVAKHGYDCDLFTPDGRPHCIQDHYTLSETSPSKIMRGADLYRKDGLCTSRLFKLWPVALNEPKISSPDFNLPRRVRANPPPLPPSLPLITHSNKSSKLPQTFSYLLYNIPLNKISIHTYVFTIWRVRIKLLKDIAIYISSS